MRLKPLTLVLGSIICSNAALASSQPPVMLKQNSDPQAVLDYWTPERMRDATPMDLPIVNQTPAMQVPVDEIMHKYKGQKPEMHYGTAPTTAITPDTHQVFQPRTPEKQNGLLGDTGTLQEQFSSQRLVPLSADLQYPYTTVGKLYFSTPSGDKTCSGVVLNTRVVMTAGHCMYSGSGWYSKYMFVPAYRDGTIPFRKWAYQSGAVPGEWYNGGGTIPNSGDWGALAFKDQTDTTTGKVYSIGKVVGTLGYQTLSAIPNHAHLLGYPGNLDNGEKMHQVTAESAVAVSPNNAEYGSDMSLGAGGGPWVQNFGDKSDGQAGGSNAARNMVIGITSYGFNDTYSFGNGTSILNSSFTGLYNFVCGQASGNCTLNPPTPPSS
jgi:V8-like Glu-specific endopeptidase